MDHDAHRLRPDRRHLPFLASKDSGGLRLNVRFDRHRENRRRNPAAFWCIPLWWGQARGDGLVGLPLISRTPRRGNSLSYTNHFGYKMKMIIRHPETPRSLKSKKSIISHGLPRPKAGEMGFRSPFGVTFVTFGGSDRP
jgi:hypothetical protein